MGGVDSGNFVSVTLCTNRVFVPGFTQAHKGLKWRRRRRRRRRKRRRKTSRL